MKTTLKCGIVELGQLEDHNDDPGVLVRTADGYEIAIPLPMETVQAIGREGLLFKNLHLTLIFEVVES